MSGQQQQHQQQALAHDYLGKGYKLAPSADWLAGLRPWTIYTSSCLAGSQYSWHQPSSSNSPSVQTRTDSALSEQEADERSYQVVLYSPWQQDQTWSRDPLPPLPPRHHASQIHIAHGRGGQQAALLSRQRPRYRQSHQKTMVRTLML